MKEIACPVCGGRIDVRPARGRKSRQPFVMLICAADGRHFRAFINDRSFVSRLIEAAERPETGRAGAPPGRGRDVP